MSSQPPIIQSFQGDTSDLEQRLNSLEGQFRTFVQNANSILEALAGGPISNLFDGAVAGLNTLRQQFEQLGPEAGQSFNQVADAMRLAFAAATAQINEARTAASAPISAPTVPPPTGAGAAGAGAAGLEEQRTRVEAELDRIATRKREVEALLADPPPPINVVDPNALRQEEADLDVRLRAIVDRKREAQAELAGAPARVQVIDTPDLDRQIESARARLEKLDRLVETHRTAGRPGLAAASERNAEIVRSQLEALEAEKARLAAAPPAPVQLIDTNRLQQELAQLSETEQQIIARKAEITAQLAAPPPPIDLVNRAALETELAELTTQGERLVAERTRLTTQIASAGVGVGVGAGSAQQQALAAAETELAAAERELTAATAERVRLQTEAANTAQVSLLITRDQRQQLLDLGHTQAEVNAMTPAEAHQILGLRNNLEELTAAERRETAALENRARAQQRVAETRQALNSVTATERTTATEAAAGAPAVVGDVETIFARVTEGAERGQAAFESLDRFTQRWGTDFAQVTELVTSGLLAIIGDAQTTEQRMRLLDETAARLKDVQAGVRGEILSKQQERTLLQAAPVGEDEAALETRRARIAQLTAEINKLSIENRALAETERAVSAAGKATSAQFAEETQTARGLSTLFLEAARLRGEAAQEGAAAEVEANRAAAAEEERFVRGLTILFRESERLRTEVTQEESARRRKIQEEDAAAARAAAIEAEQQRQFGLQQPVRAFEAEAQSIQANTALAQARFQVAQAEQAVNIARASGANPAQIAAAEQLLATAMTAEAAAANAAAAAENRLHVAQNPASTEQEVTAANQVANSLNRIAVAAKGAVTQQQQVVNSFKTSGTAARGAAGGFGRIHDSLLGVLSVSRVLPGPLAEIVSSMGLLIGAGRSVSGIFSAVGAAAFGAIASLIQFGGELNKQNAELINTAAAVGLTLPEIKALKLIAESTGQSVENFTISLRNLSQAITNQGPNAARTQSAIKQLLGPDFELQGKRAIDVLIQIGERLQDPVLQRSGTALAAFSTIAGRSYDEQAAALNNLVKISREGGTEFERLTRFFDEAGLASDEVEKKAERQRQGIINLTAAWEKFRQQIGATEVAARAVELLASTLNRPQVFATGLLAGIGPVRAAELAEEFDKVIAKQKELDAEKEKERRAAEAAGAAPSKVDALEKQTAEIRARQLEAEAEFGKVSGQARVTAEREADAEVLKARKGIYDDLQKTDAENLKNAVVSLNTFNQLLAEVQAKGGTVTFNKKTFNADDVKKEIDQAQKIFDLAKQALAQRGIILSQFDEAIRKLSVRGRTPEQEEEARDFQRQFDEMRTTAREGMANFLEDRREITARLTAEAKTGKAPFSAAIQSDIETAKLVLAQSGAELDDLIAFITERIDKLKKDLQGDVTTEFFKQTSTEITSLERTRNRLRVERGRDTRQQELAIAKAERDLTEQIGDIERNRLVLANALLDAEESRLKLLEQEGLLFGTDAKERQIAIDQRRIDLIQQEIALAKKRLATEIEGAQKLAISKQEEEVANQIGAGATPEAAAAAGVKKGQDVLAALLASEPVTKLRTEIVALGESAAEAQIRLQIADSALGRLSEVFGNLEQIAGQASSKFPGLDRIFKGAKQLADVFLARQIKAAQKSLPEQVSDAGGVFAVKVKTAGDLLIEAVQKFLLQIRPITAQAPAPSQLEKFTAVLPEGWLAGFGGEVSSRIADALKGGAAGVQTQVEARPGLAPGFGALAAQRLKDAQTELVAATQDLARATREQEELRKTEGQFFVSTDFAVAWRRALEATKLIRQREQEFADVIRGATQATASEEAKTAARRRANLEVSRAEQAVSAAQKELERATLEDAENRKKFGEGFNATQSLLAEKNLRDATKALEDARRAAATTVATPEGVKARIEELSAGKTLGGVPLAPLLSKLAEFESGFRPGIVGFEGPQVKGPKERFGLFQFAKATAEPVLKKLGKTWEEFLNNVDVQVETVTAFLQDELQKTGSLKGAFRAFGVSDPTKGTKSVIFPLIDKLRKGASKEVGTFIDKLIDSNVDELKILQSLIAANIGTEPTIQQVAKKFRGDATDAAIGYIDDLGDQSAAAIGLARPDGTVARAVGEATKKGAKALVTSTEKSAKAVEDGIEDRGSLDQPVLGRAGRDAATTVDDAVQKRAKKAAEDAAKELTAPTPILPPVLTRLPLPVEQIKPPTPIPGAVPGEQTLVPLSLDPAVKQAAQDANAEINKGGVKLVESIAEYVVDTFKLDKSAMAAVGPEAAGKIKDSAKKRTGEAADAIVEGIETQGAADDPELEATGAEEATRVDDAMQKRAKAAAQSVAGGADKKEPTKIFGQTVGKFINKAGIVAGGLIQGFSADTIGGKIAGFTSIAAAFGPIGEAVAAVGQIVGGIVDFFGGRARAAALKRAAAIEGSVDEVLKGFRAGAISTGQTIAFLNAQLESARRELGAAKDKLHQIEQNITAQVEEIRATMKAIQDKFQSALEDLRRPAEQRAPVAAFQQALDQIREFIGSFESAAEGLKHRAEAEEFLNLTFQELQKSAQDAAEAANQRVKELQDQGIQNLRDFEDARQAIINQGRVRTEFDEAKDRLAQLFALQAKRLQDERNLEKEIEKAKEDAKKQNDLLAFIETIFKKFEKILARFFRHTETAAGVEESFPKTLEALLEAANEAAGLIPKLDKDFFASIREQLLKGDTAGVTERLQGALANPSLDADTRRFINEILATLQQELASAGATSTETPEEAAARKAAKQAKKEEAAAAAATAAASTTTATSLSAATAAIDQLQVSSGKTSSTFDSLVTSMNAFSQALQGFSAQSVLEPNRIAVPLATTQASATLTIQGSLNVNVSGAGDAVANRIRDEIRSSLRGQNPISDLLSRGRPIVS